MTSPALDKAITARITVDLPAEDYARLKIAAAAGGRGVNMSTVVRERMTRPGATFTTAEMRDRLAAVHAGGK